MYRELRRLEILELKQKADEKTTGLQLQLVG
jgi:hypothetical protein